MVNKNLSTKNRILSMLRDEKGMVKGDYLASECGVSRVAVWKAIQSLQEAGYSIISTRGGYYLEMDLKDSLFPWEFGTQEKQHMHFTETDSTMTTARSIVNECSDGETRIITADMQTEGKGHDLHKWTTTKGSLAFTIAAREKIPLMETHRFVMASQIAIARVLERTSQKKISVRWPNDIWTENGKAAGILDEISATGSITNWLNLGIGINLSKKPKIKDTDCVFKNDEFTRKELLENFLDSYKEARLLALEDSNSLTAAWNSLCCDIGKKFRTGSGETVVFRGIDSLGRAAVETDGNKKLYAPCTLSLLKSF